MANQMTLPGADIARLLLERIEVCHPAPALFSSVEIDEWSIDCLAVLLECAVLKPIGRAEALWCPGCEWQCHKAVVVVRANTGLCTRAFVFCNEEPGHGRIPVPMRSLDEYGATISGLSGFIASQMKFGPPRSSPTGESFLLGHVNGRHGPRQVCVGLDARRLILQVGEQQESLVHVLGWSADGLSINVAHIRRLANRKEAASRSGGASLPVRTWLQERTRRTRARHEAILREANKLHSNREGGWTDIAKAIAGTDLAKTQQGRSITAATIRRIVTQLRRRER